MEKEYNLEALGRLFRAWGIDEKISKLTPRLLGVLNKRFGLEDGIAHTRGETGKIFGTSRVRIEQLEAKALEILRN
jgi:DNA-directed RNA polymerase sigma subunit (sigma70/sigma32)